MIISNDQIKIKYLGKKGYSLTAYVGGKMFKQKFLRFTVSQAIEVFKKHVVDSYDNH